MGSMDASQLPRPWVETPLIESAALSKAAGCRVFCKLENLQPSGSFKSRGISFSLLSHISSHPPSTPLHFYCSSGGNAGLACVTAARTLHYPATVVVPLTTSPTMIAKVKAAGATAVVQVGRSWTEADAYLREEILGKGKAGEVGVYVAPFDDEKVWEGHATLVAEVKSQMEARGETGLDALVCSVGGGGLFAGLMQGLDEFYPREEEEEEEEEKEKGKNKRVQVLALETEGAASLHTSLERGENTTLDEITSLATSLGAVRVADRAYELASQRKEVLSLVLSDAEATRGCWRFADDERMLVEPACGVCLAAVYNGALGRMMPWLTKDSKVLVVVCGGSNVTLELLEKWRTQYGSGETGKMRAEDGERGVVSV